MLDVIVHVHYENIILDQLFVQLKIALPDSNERLLLSSTSELVSLTCEELSFVEHLMNYY